MDSTDEPAVPAPGIVVRAWTVEDFPAVQRLFAAEGWDTPRDRPEAALASWRGSSVALVAEAGGAVVGLLRALGDGAVTVYVAEVVTDRAWRGRGVATALLAEAQRRNPGARLDLLATDESAPYYERVGFRPMRGYRLGWLERGRLGER